MSAHGDTEATTQPADAGTAATEPGPLRPVAGDIELPAPGYDVGEVIGRGGMGEVVSAVDRRIGREVAIKRMQSDTPHHHAVQRFLREARIQARLDHPAIVPVHELGIDDAGRPYFTMKRLAGVTLAQRLAERAPSNALLRAFVDVCLAIEFAHARDVVHRDLKPSNIMLGEYGEVYVLDWGVATVLVRAGRAPSVNADLDALDDGGTQTGDLLGTPGFMAPEQARAGVITSAVDVYALGAILFEILAGEPLHPRGTAGLASAIGMPQQSPALRVPDRDLAPELDAACVAALAEDPAARPTARALADRIQHYLDGDRDLERRVALGHELLASARAALASGDPEARALAMNRAGRALALDPQSTDAAQLVTSLIVEPPAVLPGELVAALGEEERRAGTERLRVSTFALLTVMSLTALVPLMHVRNWTTLAAGAGTVVAVALLLWRAHVRGRPHPLLSLAAGLGLAFAFSRVLGPFVLTPVVIAGSLLPLGAAVWLNRHPRWVYGWLVVAVFGPLVLEHVGVFAQTWEMIDGGMMVTSAMFRGRGTLDAPALVIANFVPLCAVAVYGVSINRRIADASQRLYIQAWHLGQLLPARAPR